MTEDRWPVTRASMIQRPHDPEDHEAWQQVIEIYSPAVYEYCTSRGLQREDALDVAQEVLTKLQAFQYDPAKGKFRAWLGTVTRNQVNLHWRKKGGQEQKLGEMPDPAVDTHLDWERLSNAHILNSAIDRIRPEFSEPQWQAFEQVALSIHDKGTTREFEWQTEATPAEVASRLGQPVQWVYKTKSEMLKRLREEVVFLAEEMILFD